MRILLVLAFLADLGMVVWISADSLGTSAKMASFGIDLEETQVGVLQVQVAWGRGFRDRALRSDVKLNAASAVLLLNVVAILSPIMSRSATGSNALARKPPA